jgi:transcriptional regulator with XRE-family HTH domain
VTLGERVLILRRRVKMSQTDLAKASDLDKKALSQIIENRKVESRKLLIFQHTIFRCCLQKATLRQNQNMSLRLENRR